jgi:hypothetical protein
MKVSKTIPTLPKGNDTEVAAKLQALVSEANDGLKRILAAGFFIECIAGELKHGQLGPWLAAHCPQVTWQTVNRWRDLARNVAQVAGVKLNIVFNLEGSFEGGNFLTLPTDELPNELSEARARIEEVIAGKTAKQLHFEFKQTENGKVKVGRLKGDGGREPERPATPSELLEHEQHCARRDWERLVLVMDQLSPRAPLLPDMDLQILAGLTDKWTKALNEWLRLPQGQRSAASAEGFTKMLKP